MTYLNEVSNALAPFSIVFVLMGVAVVVISVLSYVSAQRETQASFPVFKIGAGIAIALIPGYPGIVHILSYKILSAMGETDGRPQSPAPTPQPTATNSPPETTQTPPDFSWVAPVAVGASFVLLATIITIIFIRFGVPLIASARESARRAKTLHVEAQRIYEQTMLDAAAYETDLGKQIDFPVMTDVTSPATSAYVKAMKNATLAIRTTPAKPSLQQAELLMNEVQEFAVAFVAAEKQALLLQWSKFTATEQKRLQDARTALQLIESGGLSDEARNAQYKRIVRLLEGLITITADSKRALVAKVPMLTLTEINAG